MCCVVVEGFGEQGEGGDASQGSRRPRGGCRRGLGHASASCRLRRGCPGAMSSARTMQIWSGASAGGSVCGTHVARAYALLARGACASSSTSALEASLKYTQPWALRVTTDASSSGGLSITAGWLPRLPSRRTSIQRRLSSSFAPSAVYRKIDYIVRQATHLDVVDTRELPVLDAGSPIPNAVHPSDHVPIVATC